MIHHRRHHAQTPRVGQIRMTGSLLESMDGSVLASAEEWAVKLFHLGNIDIKHSPMAVHHLAVPIIAHIVDGGHHKTAVPQKMRPRCGACSDIQHGSGTYPRQTLEGESVLNRPFVVVREVL